MFEIRTKKVQIKLFTNRALNIFPLQKKVITNENLLTKNSDGRRILYEITRPPTLGRLMMKSNTREYNSLVYNFTQADIDNGTIYYEHLHPFLDLYANDSFLFAVKSYLAQPLEDEVSTYFKLPKTLLPIILCFTDF